jgi:hypothetical protein
MSGGLLRNAARRAKRHRRDFVVTVGAKTTFSCADVSLLMQERMVQPQPQQPEGEDDGKEVDDDQHGVREAGVVGKAQADLEQQS